MSASKPNEEDKMIIKAYKLPLETILKLPHEATTIQDTDEKEFVIKEDQVNYDGKKKEIKRIFDSPYDHRVS